MNTTQENIAVSRAFASVRSSLRVSPAFMAAIAVVAGMATEDAKAWGNNQFEQIGRTMGSEMGRQAGGGSFSTESRIGGMVGSMLGATLGRPLDEDAKEKKRLEQIEAKARDQAIRDAAYEEQRRRIDPSYQRSPNYPGQVRSSRQSNTDYESIRQNIMRAGMAAERTQLGER